MKLDKSENNFKQITSLITNSLNLKDDISHDPNFKVRYDHSDGYGIFHNNTLTAYLMSNILNSRVFTQRTKMAALGYLSAQDQTDLAELKRLITELFADLKAKKVPYANLLPRKEKRFRDYGFEDTIYKKIYQFNYDALNGFRIPKDGKVETGKWSDLVLQNGAAQLYEVPLHTTDERDTVNRPFWWWNRIESLNPNRKLAVYFGRVGLPQAYMFYEINDEQIHINEMYGMTGEGIRGLLAYLKEIGHKNTSYSLEMPAESRLEDLFEEEKQLKIIVKSYAMSRIIDIKYVLSCMKLSDDQSFVVEVTSDDLCHWNIGKWKVQKVDDEIHVSATDDKADFSGNINSWTKVLLGNLTLKEAIKFQEIEGDKHTSVQFEKGTITFYDLF